MAIVISLADIDAIETFDGLSAFVTDHLELDADTQARLPSLIRMAEYQLDRLLTTPQRESLANVSTAAGVDVVALPTDFRQIRSIRYMADDGYPLGFVSPNVLQASGTSGRPRVYSIINGQLWIGPTPDAVYLMQMVYLAGIPKLSSANQTNWLLAQNADVYVYAVLQQAALFQGDAEIAALMQSPLDAAVFAINQQGARYRRGSPVRLQSPVVV